MQTISSFKSLVIKGILYRQPANSGKALKAVNEISQINSKSTDHQLPPLAIMFVYEASLTSAYLPTEQSALLTITAPYVNSSATG